MDRLLVTAEGGVTALLLLHGQHVVFDWEIGCGLPERYVQRNASRYLKCLAKVVNTA